MEQSSDHRILELPAQKNYDVSQGLALKLAEEKLRQIVDVEDLCRKSGSVCQKIDSGHLIQVTFLNRVYRISWPELNIAPESKGTPLETRDKILILDYLNNARGVPLTGQAMTFQELSAVSSYYPTFFKRAVKPLVDHFGNCPQELLGASQDLGGTKADYGDFSIVIPAFSRVPITLVIWKGDEEFPPNANILFDKSILHYLPIEDIIVLCQIISWKLVKLHSS